MVGHMRNSASRVLVVLITAPNRREAGRIGKAVVEKRVGACVSIVPSIRSIFRWKRRVQESRETLLVVKTTGHRFPALMKLVRSMHSYDVPEIIALRVERGLKRYIAWVQQETAID
jgi:periplasmic divalent cation tolerance protein